MQLIDILILVAALGSGLVAGIFFAFSTFVMRALGQLPPDQGIAAMKAINVTVLNPWFFLAFFGTTAVCLPIAGLTIGSSTGSDPIYVLAGCVLYVVGCFGVTAALNVPLNNRLAAVDSGTASAHSFWSFYLARWTLWNHVRTAASLAAAALFIVAHVAGS